MIREAELPLALADVARGEVAALRAIFNLEGPYLFGVAAAILRDRLRAADAVQQALVAAWRGAARVAAEGRDVRSWLTDLVREAALTLARQDGRETEVEASLIDPEARLAGPIGEVLASLDTMPRAVLLLAYVNGLSLPQIAARLDVPLGAVRPALLRALQAFA